MKNSASVVHVRLLAGRTIQIFLARTSEDDDSVSAYALQNKHYPSS